MEGTAQVVGHGREDGEVPAVCELHWDFPREKVEVKIKLTQQGELSKFHWYCAIEFIGNEEERLK